MDNKKRRHKPNYGSSDYIPRYKQRIGNHRDDWRSTDFREKENRYSERQEREISGAQYRDGADTLWDVEINLIGQKESNPMIHPCDTCRLPIRSYGRLIPCKHVFCFKCAKKTDKNCPRCGDEVHRIEQCRHGTVWMCVISNCNRTYLSQRDLQAHVHHRHSKPPPPPSLPAINTAPPINVPPPQLPGAMLVPPPPVSTIPQISPYVIMPNVSSNQPLPPVSIPPPENVPISTAQPVDIIARPSSNLITIQIQDDQQNSSVFNQSGEQLTSSTSYNTTSIPSNPQNSQSSRTNLNSNAPWIPPHSGRSQNHTSSY